MQTRRQLIKALAAGGMLGASGLATSAPRLTHREDHGDKHLKLLILGGTGFIGPHMVRQARARGHQVTLFNRGQTNADLFPDVEV